ncbi:MAG: preprotein translocase subunit SecE [Christensenellales bacterium]|jgi:preprotein translocase subunit SecE
MAKDKQLKDEKNKKPEKVKKKRRGLLAAIRDIISELKKVTWPTKKEAAKYTATVVVFVAVFAVILGAMDYVLATGLTAAKGLFS